MSLLLIYVIAELLLYYIEMDNLGYIVELLILLTGILAACLTFANAIEHLGEDLNLGNQVTGSILAAVGTALPETIIPLMAIFMAGKAASHEAAHGIAVGSIIGAPFMLSTLALFVRGATLIICKKKRGTSDLVVNIKHVKRDLSYFLIAFTILISATMFNTNMKIFAAVLLLLLYAFYIIQTIKAESEAQEVETFDLPKLYLSHFRLPENRMIIIIQTLIGLGGIIFLAEKFVHALETASNAWGISPLILSLLITPIATELPEKVNSVTWASQKKDTLAVGNLTGAMVFQSTIPGTIGLLFTPWVFDKLTTMSALLAVISTSVLFGFIQIRGKVKGKYLLGALIPYLIYIYFAFFN